MKEYSDEEIIDLLLKKCIEGRLSVTNFIENTLGIKDHFQQSDRIINFIQDNNLADISINDFIASNPTTVKLVKTGGYLAYLDRELAKQLHDDKIKKAADDLVLIDLTIAKWKKNTFWPVFIGGIIGGIMGAISLLGQLNLLHLPDLAKHRQASGESIDSVSYNPPLDSAVRHE
jgi:hypothetical protein